MPFKRLLIITLFLSLVIPQLTLASPRQTIAILPVINYAQYQDPDLSKKIQREINEHIPIIAYQKIPSERIMPKILMINNGKPFINLPNHQTLRQIAMKLPVDKVIAVEINEVHSRLFTSLFSDETYEDSLLVLTCALYEKKRDMYIREKSEKSALVELSAESGPVKLASECMVDIFKKLNL